MGNYITPLLFILMMIFISIFGRRIHNWFESSERPKYPMINCPTCSGSGQEGGQVCWGCSGKRIVNIETWNFGLENIYGGMEDEDEKRKT